ncbi:MAG: TetR/AcrR family transcriptional regulator [Pseudomonadota bacterium]
MTDQNLKKRSRGRPRLDASDGRDDIKRAALAEFAKRGFKGASVDHIAKRAKVAKRLIHYHFGSKDALWHEAVSDAYNEFQKEILDFISERQNHQDASLLDAVSKQIVFFAASRISLIHISIDETRQGGERSDWLKSTYLIPFQKIMAHQIGLYLGDNAKGQAVAAHLVPAIFGAIVFPYVDADVVSEAHERDVFSQNYQTEHIALISALIKASLHDV